MTDEELTNALRAWDAPLPAAVAARVHARARAAFESGRGGGAERIAALVTVTGCLAACAVYLAWAARFLGALGGG